MLANVDVLRVGVVTIVQSQLFLTDELAFLFDGRRACMQELETYLDDTYLL